MPTDRSIERKETNNLTINKNKNESGKEMKRKKTKKDREINRVAVGKDG